MKEKTIILVSSCDAFEECWKPFEKGIIEQWNDCPYPIYLMTNEKEYVSERLHCLPVGKDLKWASNMRTALAKLPESEWIIYLQEDYWLDRPVNSKAIENHIHYCEEKGIDYLRLAYPFMDGKSEDGVHQENDPQAPYALCLQAALWRREKLMELLVDGWSGWDFELKIRDYLLEKQIPIRCGGLYREQWFEQGLKYVDGTAVRKGCWTRAAIQYLKKHEMEELIPLRKVEGILKTWYCESQLMRWVKSLRQSF